MIPIKDYRPITLPIQEELITTWKPWEEETRHIPALLPLEPKRKGIIPQHILGFSIVGGSVMVGGTLFLFILVQFLHVERNLAYFLQAIASIETNFFLNRFLNWKERDGHLAIQWLKFHSTSAITFPLNQVLFALLTWIGVHYLIMMGIGAGTAAIINYITNDRFVYTEKDISYKETIRVPVVLPMKLTPPVGIIMPVRNSARTICRCIESLLAQDYTGSLHIFIVGNPGERDNTWEALDDFFYRPCIHRIEVDRPSYWVGRDANLKRYIGSDIAREYGVEVIAFIDSQVEASPTWVSSAITTMQEYNTDGLAGISCRHHDDTSLENVYQDGSLFSEWPRYGTRFFLTEKTFGRARGLPITANLFVKSYVLEHIHDRWPSNCTHGWEDFQLAWEIARGGFTLLCTDTIAVYRNHKRKFRIVKHFSAGAGAVAFHLQNPTCSYTKQRLAKSLLVLLVGIGSIALVSSAIFFSLPLLLCPFPLLWILLGYMSVTRAKDWRGLYFPLLDCIHIGAWIGGAIYTLVQGGSIKPYVADKLIKLR